MTSRQPGTTAPGTTAPQTTAPQTTAPQTTGRTPERNPHTARGRSWMVVLPLVLLIILALAGLRGVVVTPRWNGPLRQDYLAIGLALEAVLGVVLAALIRRRSRLARAARRSGAPLRDVPARLRAMLIFCSRRA